LLVPGTYAGGHQARNAAYLQQQGAAVVIPESELASRLAAGVTELLLDGARLAEMAAAARRLARPEACRAIVAELQRAAGCFPV
jgi:UDP-N-acetylglucosamine--N-acetylmuramyl-(pentapeptide) pyrophosphoryl-undecaprenol N-acetylglucosamine transferase